MGSSTIPISIIIPTYNEEKKIEETIISVKNQKTNIKYETIIIDGGSTDRTVQIAKKYVKVIKSPKRGKVPQVNYAVKQSNGKILIFLDADTIIPENYLEIIYKNFQKDENLIACSIRHIYQSNELISPGILFLSLLYSMVQLFIFAILVIYQMMFYFFKWDKKFNPITKYFVYSQFLYTYFLFRDFFNFTELSGSNICIRKETFNSIGGLKPVPNSEGTDAVFSSALRYYCRTHKKRIKIINNFTVKTDPRFISWKRISKRLVQHKKIAKFYQKVSNNNNFNQNDKKPEIN